MICAAATRATHAAHKRVLAWNGRDKEDVEIVFRVQKNCQLLKLMTEELTGQIFIDCHESRFEWNFMSSVLWVKGWR